MYLFIQNSTEIRIIKISMIYYKFNSSIYYVLFYSDEF